MQGNSVPGGKGMTEGGLGMWISTSAVKKEEATGPGLHLWEFCLWFLRPFGCNRGRGGTEGVVEVRKVPAFSLLHSLLPLAAAVRLCPVLVNPRPVWQSLFGTASSRVEGPRQLSLRPPLWGRAGKEEGGKAFLWRRADCRRWIVCCFCLTLPRGRLFLTGFCHCKKLFPKSGTIRGWLCKHSWWNWEAIGTTQWIILLGAFMNPAQWLFTVSLIDQEC